MFAKVTLFRRRLFSDPSLLMIERIDDILADPVQSGQFWQIFEESYAAWISALIPLMSEIAQVVIHHPLESEILHISKDPDALSRGLAAATEGVDVVVHELGLNARLPEW